MFLILQEYAPTLVPYSIDEGFLDFSTIDAHVWRNTTPTDYVQGIRERILKEVRLPVTAGLANSAKLAKLSTDAAKGVGFLEVPAGREKDFLNDRPVQELSGLRPIHRSDPRKAQGQRTPVRCLFIKKYSRHPWPEDDAKPAKNAKNEEANGGGIGRQRQDALGVGN